MSDQEIVNLINELPLDLRVEVVVGDIINSGYDANELFIQPAGLFKRRFNKDILNAEVVEFKNYRDAVLVTTSREGVYDMLPQVFFHNPPAKNSKIFKSVRDMIDEYKRRVVEEKEARKFLMVYEIEFYRQRVANSIHERNLTDAVAYSMNDSEMLSYWHLPPVFDNRQKGILFYLFPVFHKIRGDINYMQEVYRLILNDDITIEKSNNAPRLYYDNTDFTLGNIILSGNSIIGNGYDYYYPVISINVNPPKESLFNYLPAAKNIRIIEKLNDYFMPLFCETEIKIDTGKNNWLLNDEEINESRLGYSMSI